MMTLILVMAVVYLNCKECSISFNGFDRVPLLVYICYKFNLICLHQALSHDDHVYCGRRDIYVDV